MLDFLFGQQITTIITTRTRTIITLTYKSVSEALIGYYKKEITKEEFNK